MRVEALLFDFDHTLVDSPIDFVAMRRAVLAVCASHGVVVPDADGKLILEIVEEAAALARDGQGPRLRGKADSCMRDEERKAARQAAVVPGVSEALHRLRAEGRRIAIITRNCREVVDTALERAPLEYDVLLARDDVTEVKPHPAHAAAALAALGVGAEAALMVGDFRADMACARAAGIVALGVATGASTAAELLAAGAAAVLPSAAEVPAWLAARGW
jgi:phosphoglycolate phosphatase